MQVLLCIVSVNVVLGFNIVIHLLTYVRTGDIKSHDQQFWLCNTAGFFLIGVMEFSAGEYGSAGFQMGIFVISLFMWWKSGGGDDTKRRLRRLREKFAGVRRTAPAVG